MVRYLRLGEVIELQRRLIEQSGGAHGLRDLGALLSSITQPRMGFGGADLYPTLSEKAATLAFCLISNHPFLDGNKRVGHAAMEVFLVLNGHELEAHEDEAEETILGIASGAFALREFTAWVGAHVVERPEGGAL
jgi:death-on-curing protein